MFEIHFFVRIVTLQPTCGDAGTPFDDEGAKHLLEVLPLMNLRVLQMPGAHTHCASWGTAHPSPHRPHHNPCEVSTLTSPSRVPPRPTTTKTKPPDRNPNFPPRARLRSGVTLTRHVTLTNLDSSPLPRPTFDLTLTIDLAAPSPSLELTQTLALYPSPNSMNTSLCVRAGALCQVGKEIISAGV